ncbi:MAG TPA: 1-(5-phosphoribosyl)-5-((5-phosphoribosylamino)methylideneamino)imidazole-4-carboxamide isomerase [Gammaproteobacteria bacterium]|jgi:DUF971 family protein|nr:1-(5-phosphoribosyl)-5-((5-phosphoribosylamino)methylideneamino)imidazole-4-carboxamide isomerase [Acidiferrobacteraceae bacterium]MDP6551937.1 DUF971 domain-containing protein [Arenicellales bacterium]MDP6791338.1 DUF971 domain-containing protein [Arenicellales bacterium]MDP6919341.1 DUF971 domain-containing protein [Arenicellales bacterium]HCX88466.1 1-(5-phosphoribosyl)-5-((5-phosphoribosylamino)methylideneamino)imidazole-4-carboxamide isomerase [Gammaproteobacteria bacterium]|tara:strand:- start:54690 stop:55058 length:369 start_codon:yes stop_codon:yes gene_type:complete
MTAKPRPTRIVLHQQSRTLEVAFDDDSLFNLSCEYLRVFSPSAEVRGHGPGQQVLQTGKENVNISAVEAVGAYAVKLIFDDGHDSGIYSWETLYELGSQQEAYWQAYLEELKEAGYGRQAAS